MLTAQIVSHHVTHLAHHLATHGVAIGHTIQHLLVHYHVSQLISTHHVELGWMLSGVVGVLIIFAMLDDR